MRKEKKEKHEKTPEETKTSITASTFLNQRIKKKKNMEKKSHENNTRNKTPIKIVTKEEKTKIKNID